MFKTFANSKPPVPALKQDGFSLLQPNDLIGTFHLSTPQQDWLKAWNPLRDSWNRLEPDTHLKDGGSYRKRRHSCFIQEWPVAQPEEAPKTIPVGSLIQTAHRAHWQPTDYNALHGGFERWFEPIEESVCTAPAWIKLLSHLGLVFRSIRPTTHWYIEAHQFRIDTAAGVGRPTPEGAHRDGVDFVVVMLVGRHGVKGGETRVFDANGPYGMRFLMQQPLTTLLLDDEKVIHETTPIQPAVDQQLDGFRDTLVLTYRAAGFQAP